MQTFTREQMLNFKGTDIMNLTSEELNEVDTFYSKYYSELVENYENGEITKKELVNCLEEIPATTNVFVENYKYGIFSNYKQQLTLKLDFLELDLNNQKEIIKQMLVDRYELFKEVDLEFHKKLYYDLYNELVESELIKLLDDDIMIVIENPFFANDDKNYCRTKICNCGMIYSKIGNSLYDYDYIAS